MSIRVSCRTSVNDEALGPETRDPNDLADHDDRGGYWALGSSRVSLGVSQESGRGNGSTSKQGDENMWFAP